MKSRIVIIGLFFLIQNYCIGQIANSDFEEWEVQFSEEEPVNWSCNGLFLGACTKVELDITNFAVRMDNSLPCIDIATNTAKSLGHGDLSQYFTAPSHEFTLSYDLTVDSIDQPAVFILTLFKSGIGNFLRAEHNDIFAGTVTHHISMPTGFGLDDIQITLEPNGLKKESAKHDCDLGYISAIIDNIQIEETVSTNRLIEGGLKVYPNPTDGDINIRSFDRAIERVEVYDFLGRKLLDQHVGHSDLVQLNLAEMGEMLFLKVIDSEGNAWLRKVTVD